MASLVQGSVPVTVCVGRERKLFGASAAFERLTEFSNEDLQSLTFEALLGPVRDHDLSAQLEHALTHGELFAGELLCRKKSGTLFWNDLVLVPMPTCHLAVCRDVTARRVNESVPGLRVPHDRAVLDAIEAGIIVHKANTEISYANAKASDMLGITADALLGVMNADPRWRFFDQDQRPLSVDAFPVARALASRKAVLHMLIGVQRPNDGQMTWGLCNAHPLLSADGEVHEVVVSFTDVTELKQAEFALQKSEERLRLVLQGSNDAPWDWALPTNDLYYSPRWWQMLGYEVNELPTDASLWTRLLHPDDRARVPQQLEQWVRGGASQYEIEFRLQRKQGDFASVLSRGFIKRDQTGQATRISGTNTDVTERRALEDKLRQSQKMEAVGQLAGGVAHDFNNLLSIIVGNLEFVAEQLGDSPEAQDSLRDALAASQRGAELTSRLLSFSRQQPLQQQVIDVGAALQSLSTVLRRLISESIQIDVRCAPGLARISTDPALLETALLNLAINARDAMPSGGTLTISAGWGPDGTVQLAVTDTGTGMTAEVKDRALDPFFTTKPTGKGTGLGLSMVYGFVQQSGGTLQLISAPSAGTTVVLAFPPAVVEASAANPSERLPQPAAQPRDDVVLVVEDEPSVRRLCVRALERLGYQTLVASDGPEALVVLDSTARIDLLLTDVVMPRGLSGPALAVAAQQRRPALKVLFMSGYLPSSFDAETRASIQPLLSKPFSSADLARSVAEALAGRLQTSSSFRSGPT